MKTATTYEYNYYRVKAVNSRNPVGGVVLGYELIRRPVGTRKWEVVSRTQDEAEAEAWADQK